MRRLVIPVIAVLAACAPAHPWRNSHLPEAVWGQDENMCRREAEKTMGPEAAEPVGNYAPDNPLQSGAPQSGYARDNPVELAQRGDDRKQFDNLVAQCMERKGYTHIRGP